MSSRELTSKELLTHSLPDFDSVSSQCRTSDELPRYHHRPDTESDATFPIGPYGNSRTESQQSFLPITPSREVQPALRQSKSESKSIFRGDWWLWEFLSILVSVLSLIAMIILLHVYEGKVMPDWPMGITLNALIAAMSSVVKASLLVPVANCISQLKWLYFRDPRSLRDFEAFDDASRGPWGSLQLLWKVRSMHVVAIGSLITVLSISMDPFVQQIVAYSLHWETSTSRGMAVRAQIYDEGPNIYQYIAPSCPTGNCFFDAFNSLAFCSKCANVTGETSRDAIQGNGPGWTEAPEGFWNLNLTYHFPGGALVNLTAWYRDSSLKDLLHGPSLISTEVPANTSADALGIKNPMLSLAILQFPKVDADGYEGNYLAETPVAWQCALYFCVNTYNISVENGQTNSTVISTWYENDVPSVIPPGNKDVVLQRPNNLPHSLPKYSNLTFTIPAQTFDTIMWYLNKTLVGSVLTRTAEVGMDDTMINDVLEAMKVSTNIGSLVGNLATSLSNHIREIYSQAYMNQSTGQKDITYPDAAVAGVSLTVVTYVQVRWKWLSMPVLMVAAALGFLLVTVAANSKTRYPVWKSSSLAVLYHGLDGQGGGEGVVQTRGVKTNHLSEMRDAASRSLVSVGKGRGPDETFQLVPRN